MSQEVVSAVWKGSKASASDLLVLLYIADQCNDDGSGAHPATSRIARACRMSERAIHAALQTLSALGELTIIPNAGPHRVNAFRVNLVCLDTADIAAPQMLRGCTYPAVVAVSKQRIASIDRKYVNRQSDSQTVTKKRTKNSLLRIEKIEPGISFDEWYQRYPKHEARPNAERAWNKLTADQKRAAFDALATYKFSPERRFIPQPATWLNGERWTDEQGATTPRNGLVF